MALGGGLGPLDCHEKMSKQTGLEVDDGAAKYGGLSH